MEKISNESYIRYIILTIGTLKDRLQVINEEILFLKGKLAAYEEIKRYQLSLGTENDDGNKDTEAMG